MTFDVDYEISKVHLESTGWKLTSFNSSTPFESAFLYL
jgi:hypothetical protein